MVAKPPAIMNDHESPRIPVADVASGALWPVANGDWVVLASDYAPWQDSLLVEQHRRPPFEGSEHAPYAHHICIRLSSPSLMDWWIAGERPRRQLIAPGEVHIDPAGVPMWNRWQEPIETLVLALKPAVVQQAA